MGFKLSGLTKALGVVNPLTLGIPSLMADMNKRPEPSIGPYQMKPLADPSQINADPGLMKTLGATGTKAQNDLASVYGRIRGNYNADAAARGVAPGEYANSRLNVAQQQGNAGIQNSLESVLGNTAYGDFQGQRGYSQQENLAREIASLNKPTTLEEILSGLSGAANTGGNLYGALGGRGRAAPLALPELSGYDSYSRYA